MTKHHDANKKTYMLHPVPFGMAVFPKLKIIYFNTLFQLGTYTMALTDRFSRQYWWYHGLCTVWLEECEWAIDPILK